MTSQSGSSTSKTPDIATFSSEVSNALKTTQQLQDNVHKLLQTFIEWSSHESEESLTKVKETIKEIQSCQRLNKKYKIFEYCWTRINEYQPKLQSKIEKVSSAFPKLPETKPVALGNSGLISLDPGEDRSSVYQDLLEAYTWVTKLNSDASTALKSLKRKYPEPEIFPFKSKKAPEDNTKFLHELLPVLQTQNPELILTVGDKRVPCLKIIIKGVLCAIIIFNGCYLDRIIVRSDSEDVLTTQCLDSWTPSKFIVFRKVTNNCQAALLKFYSPAQCSRAAKEFVKWLSFYKGLFAERCEHCHKHLKVETQEGHLLPPCWRDTLTNKAYHSTCR